MFFCKHGANFANMVQTVIQLLVQTVIQLLRFFEVLEALKMTWVGWRVGFFVGEKHPAGIRDNTQRVFRDSREFPLSLKS